jgi:RNA-binding protein 42
VSFLDPHDGMRALREKNGKYMGARPVKLRKSNWQERALETKRAQKKSRRRY